MTFDLNAVPEYRLEGDRHRHVTGQVIAPGRTFMTYEVPPHGSVGINENAKRILAWKAKVSVPGSIFSKLHGGIYLPGAPATSQGLCPIEKAPAGAPLYRLGYFSMTVEGVGVTELEPVALLGWPQRQCGWKPENKAAVDVLAYLTHFEGHDELPAAPWCFYRMAIILPELPPSAGRVSYEERKRRESQDREADVASGGTGLSDYRPWKAYQIAGHVQQPRIPTAGMIINPPRSKGGAKPAKASRHH